MELPVAVRLPCGLGGEGSRSDAAASPGSPEQVLRVEKPFPRSQEGHANYPSQSAPSWADRQVPGRRQECLLEGWEVL